MHSLNFFFYWWYVIHNLFFKNFVRRLGENLALFFFYNYYENIIKTGLGKGFELYGFYVTNQGV